MNFIFSNIFSTVFFVSDNGLKDYKNSSFLKKLVFIYKLLLRLSIEKLPLIIKNGGIFSYK